jgi:hypothetical protein
MARSLGYKQQPTVEMISDFFTKPQQGGMFQRFRDIVMGVKHQSSIRVPTSQGQEHVGNKALERAGRGLEVIASSSVKGSLVRLGFE